jgi:hypothetical protein
MDDPKPMYRAKELYSEPGRKGALPVSKPTFFKNLREGFYPPGRLVSPNVRCWTADEVAAMRGDRPASQPQLAETAA